MKHLTAVDVLTLRDFHPQEEITTGDANLGSIVLTTLRANSSRSIMQSLGRVRVYISLWHGDILLAAAPRSSRARRYCII